MVAFPQHFGKYSQLKLKMRICVGWVEGRRRRRRLPAG